MITRAGTITVARSERMGRVDRRPSPMGLGRGKQWLAVVVMVVLLAIFVAVWGLGRVDYAPVLEVPYLNQREEFPTGCESCAAVMVLQYFGIEMEVHTFIDEYLPMGNAPVESAPGEWVGCDPRRAFPGDPREDTGWGCYASVITKALLNVVDPQRFSVLEIYGASLSSLCKDYVAQGIPVLVWTTIDLAPVEESLSWTIEGTEDTFLWKGPLHCVVLIGSNTGHYILNDPLVSKNLAVPKEAMEAAYTGMGTQAVAVVPVEG